MVLPHAHFESGKPGLIALTPSPGTARWWLAVIHILQQQHARQMALIVVREAALRDKCVGIAIATERTAYAVSRDFDTNAVTASSNCSSVTGLARTGAC